MTKTKTKRVTRKRKPTDATLRNVRAAIKRDLKGMASDQRTRQTVLGLSMEVAGIVRQFGDFDRRLTELEGRMTAHEGIVPGQPWRR